MTREQAREAAAVMLAWADGKEVQFKLNGNSLWTTSSTNQELGFDWSVSTYRIKPAKTLRPWTADEVPLGAWLRYKGNPQSIRLLIVSNTECGLVGYQTNWPYKTLLQEMEHSTDGGKTWLPCGVEEESK